MFLARLISPSLPMLGVVALAPAAARAQTASAASFALVVGSNAAGAGQQELRYEPSPASGRGDQI